VQVCLTMGRGEGFVRQVVWIIMTNYFGGAEVAWGTESSSRPPPKGGHTPVNPDCTTRDSRRIVDCTA
jgi:hypothetical protein